MKGYNEYQIVTQKDERRTRTIEIENDILENELTMTKLSCVELSVQNWSIKRQLLAIYMAGRAHSDADSRQISRRGS